MASNMCYIGMIPALRRYVYNQDLALNCDLSTVKNRDGSRTMQLAAVESVSVEPDNLKPFLLRCSARLQSSSIRNASARIGACKYNLKCTRLSTLRMLDLA